MNGPADAPAPRPARRTGVPRRVLVVGGGAREHAIAWRLAGEPGVDAVLVAPGNDAIAALPRVTCVAVRPSHGPEVAALASREDVDLAVIGPEAPLAAGVADALRAAGIATFGPSAAAARIETSKAFCRELAAAAGIRMPRGAAFTDAASARAFAAELARDGHGVVVKADGLMAGKGVLVCDDAAEAVAGIDALFGRAGAGPGSAAAGAPPPGSAAPAAPVVVVEERLTGREASVIAICDGLTALPLPAARDHKRIGDGDTGPNTGGMGAFAPIPDMSDAAVAETVRAFHAPALAELERRGTPFVGALYAGLMLTADGPVLLEFNARFGDPEAQVLLPLVATPLAPVLLAAALGRLGDAPAAGDPPAIVADDAAAVGIVLASDGYPEAPLGGDEIRGLDAAAAAGALVFHAGTERGADGVWRTTGGRALTVVGVGPELATAREVAERAAGRISFRGMRRRHDIALGADAGPAGATPLAGAAPLSGATPLAGAAEVPA